MTNQEIAEGFRQEALRLERRAYAMKEVAKILTSPRAGDIVKANALLKMTEEES